MEKQLVSILLVDDDEISNFVTESLISEMNISQELVVLTDGFQALEYIENHPVIAGKKRGRILVLLDLNMPVMDGFEFMEEFQQRNWKDNVLVVMLTSSSNPKDLGKAKTYNFTDYLQKPFKQEDILRLIKGH